MNTEPPSCVAIIVKKKNPKKSPERGEPKTTSESSRRYREAMEEFFKGRSDFSKREGHISAVLPQGSPGKEDPMPEDEE